MALRSRGSSYEWRCRVSKSIDCSSKTIKAGSFFQHTKLTLTQALKVLIMWIQKYSSGQISAEVGISKQTRVFFEHAFRDIFTYEVTQSWNFSWFSPLLVMSFDIKTVLSLLLLQFKDTAATYRRIKQA
ncbi:unnamed protein product [Caenorhabditis sp. 36 PRJEB53466]|nr:unnamed protein product [Caenorhabditis sp. 36 PRJEB53466]